MSIFLCEWCGIIYKHINMTSYLHHLLQIIFNFYTDSFTNISQNIPWNFRNNLKFSLEISKKIQVGVFFWTHCRYLLSAMRCMLCLCHFYRMYCNYCSSVSVSFRDCNLSSNWILQEFLSRWCGLPRYIMSLCFILIICHYRQYCLHSKR